MEIKLSKCTYYNGFCYETRQLCKDVDDKFCTYKQLQQLKAENEKLKEQIKSNGFGMFNIQMAQCLDEIEGICNKYYKSDDELSKIRNKKWLYAFSKGVITGENNVANEILQLIKQAKEGEE